MFCLAVHVCSDFPCPVRVITLGDSSLNLDKLSYLDYVAEYNRIHFSVSQTWLSKYATASGHVELLVYSVRRPTALNYFISQYAL